MSKRNDKSKNRALRFERKNDRLAPTSVFVKRLLASLGIALCLIAVALSIGIAGYHVLGRFNLIDSLLEASMILGGMGPVNELSNNAVKIFASTYALFSGLMFIAVMGIVLAPVVHRILHKFHVDESDSG